MGETYDGGIGFMIAGAPVLALGDIGRARLHEAERHIGPYENMAVETGTYKRIHTVDRAL